jgi:hypothetical protein
VSLVSVLERNWAQTREHVKEIKTGETAESPVFMRLFTHVNENRELGGWELVEYPTLSAILLNCRNPVKSAVGRISAGFASMYRAGRKRLELVLRRLFVGAVDGCGFRERRFGLGNFLQVDECKTQAVFIARVAGVIGF